jgi:uncharacterized protein (DUF885 family)
MRQFLLFLFLFISSDILATGNTRNPYTDSLNAFFNKVYYDYLDRHPMYQSYQGIRKDYGLWDIYTDEQDSLELEIVKKNLKKLEGYDIRNLDEQGTLSYLTFRYNCEVAIAGEKFRYHNFPVNQLFGIHNEIPGFLINVHQIDSLQDAYDYLSRLSKVDELMVQVISKIQNRAARGIIPPAFVFPKVIANCRAIISGYPFDQDEPQSQLFLDFKGKISKIGLSQPQIDELTAEAERILKSDFYAGYQNLISYLTALQKTAVYSRGAWGLPDGRAFYRYALKEMTTTDLSPQKIFRTGQKEVARIKKEMELIKAKTGYTGTLKDFFTYLKNDPRFYFSNDSAGRQKYLSEVNKVIGAMRSVLPQLFEVQPQAELIVKPVESYREQSTAGAFYEPPAPDGKRPGIYYVNLHDMRAMPVFEIEALAYHEAIPGHHMQIAIAQELKNLPEFRKHQFYAAYAEGWGLYSELLPVQYGFYNDPYSNFGRLSKELFRACRLVVDVGIHYKKWTREQAIAYLLENTPSSEVDCIREVERYFVLPAQATSYKVGMLEIQRLRAEAEKKMGAGFDLKKFHSVILMNGALPFPLVQKAVNESLK